MPFVETPLAKDLDVAEQKVRYDSSAKRIIAHKPIIARIAKHVVPEVSQYTIKEIEGFINNVEVGKVYLEPGMTNTRIVNDELENKIEGEGRIVFDIRFFLTLPDGNSVKLIINIEVQQKSNPGYGIVKRGIFYVARLLSSQLEVEFTNNGTDRAQYDKLKKVYSIWICMDCPKDKENSIISYNLQPNVLYSGNENLTADYDCDLINVTIIHLSKLPETSDDELIDMLDILLAKQMDTKSKKEKLQTKHNIPISVEIAKEMNNMCNLSDGVYEAGKNEGRLEGILEGKIEGRLEGKIEGKREGRLEGKIEGKREGRLEGKLEGKFESELTSIRNLMANMKLSAQAAMSAIGIKEADFPKYLALL